MDQTWSTSISNQSKIKLRIIFCPVSWNDHFLKCFLFCFFFNGVLKIPKKKWIGTRSNFHRLIRSRPDNDALLPFRTRQLVGWWAHCGGPTTALSICGGTKERARIGLAAARGRPTRLFFFFFAFFLKICFFFLNRFIDCDLVEGTLAPQRPAASTWRSSDFFFLLPCYGFIVNLNMFFLFITVPRDAYLKKKEKEKGWCAMLRPTLVPVVLLQWKRASGYDNS